MARSSRMAVWACVIITALPLTALGQTWQVGQAQQLTVLTLSMQVGSTECQTKQVAYAPPPGWYVRSHWVNCTRRAGNTSYSVNTVPQGWSYISEEQVQEAYKTLIDLAGQAQNVALRTKFANEREQLLAEIRQVRSTHHALIVDATVRGEGFLRGGAVLELTVTAELVYVGTEESLAQTVARHKETLK